MPRTAFPIGFVPFMLPSLIEAPPEGDQWLHEVKYDGYRTELTIAGRDLHAFTRNGHDWTDRYAPVIASARALRCKSAIVDGEMCVQDARGVTDFGARSRRRCGANPSAWCCSPSICWRWTAAISAAIRSSTGGGGSRICSSPRRRHGSISAATTSARARRSFARPSSTTSRASLLFTDVQMPGMSGFELARAVAARWPEIAIVVASGQAKPGPGDMPDGATYIAKPFSADMVHGHLAEILPDGKKPEPLKRRS